MTKHALVKEQIIERLRDMQPRQRFLSRHAMCAKYGISRMTADAVAAELVSEGYLYAVKGSGTFVSPHLPPVSDSGADEAVYAWGVLMPDVRYSRSPDMFSGIERFARRHGISMTVCNTDDDADREHAFIRRLISGGADGLIIVPSYQLNLDNYRYIKERGIPFVFWNRAVDALPWAPQICISGYHGGLIATRHLLEKGYRRVAYIAPRRFRSSMDRFYGYCSALEEAGVPQRSEDICLSLPDESDEAAYACVLKMLRRADAPDAFLLFVDRMAAPAARAVADAGLKVSDDVGLIGFESSIAEADERLPETLLTYVVINSAESGCRAAEVLYGMLRGKPREENTLIVVQPQLCVRDTCKGKKERRK